MKQAFSILCVIIVTSSVFSQAPAIQWQNTIGGNSDDELYSVHQTVDGGYILGGTSKSIISGDKTEGHQAQDYWVVKLNSSGLIEWQNTIGGSSDDYLECVQQTSDGGYILGGYSNSNISGDKTENSVGSFDYWVIKLNSSGSIIWQNTIGGALEDKLHSIQQTSDGGYILGGESKSDITGDKTENNFGSSDYWVIKINSTGGIVWQNDIGSFSDEYLNSVKQTSDGGYILAGYTNSGIAGDKTENSLGGTDYWVVKLNSSGVIEWQNTIGGSSEDNLFSAEQTTDGGYILGGWSYSGISADKTDATNGNYDYWIVKINSLGNIQWQNGIGGSDADYLYSVQQTTDGGYILGGYSRSVISGDKADPKIGGNDYWILKLNSTGTIIWQNAIGGSAGDLIQSPHTLEQTVDGGFVVGGYSSSNISGDKTENSMGSTDYWVVKLIGDSILIYEVPSALFTDNITSTTAKVHWNNVPTADSYKVFYRVTGGGAWTKKTATSNFKNLPGLMPSTTYEWKVRSNCGVESSDFSAIETFTTLPMKEGELNSDLINIYPNPTNGNLLIDFENNLEGSAIITIINIAGIQILNLNQNISNGILELDFRNNASGIYIIKVNHNGCEYIQKIIKE